MNTVTFFTGLVQVLTLGAALVGCSESDAANGSTPREDGGTTTDGGVAVNPDGTASGDEGGSIDGAGMSNMAPPACPVATWCSGSTRSARRSTRLWASTSAI